MATMTRCCAFTSGDSVADGRSKTDCRRRAEPNASIACERCCPGQRTWHCAVCYRKFQLAIEARTKDLEVSSGGKLVKRPEIEALLESREGGN